jgi:hypothetical protein
MADKNPSGLTAASSPDGTEIVHVVQGGNSRKLTLDDILAITHTHAISDVTDLQTALDDKIDDSQAGAGGLSVLGAADASAVRAAAGVIIGTDVQAYDAQLTDLAGLSYASNALKVVRVNAGETAFELAAVGTGDMLSTNNLSDLDDAATARTNLGLGAAAVKATGTSGNTVPLLDGANTWSADQIVPDEAYDATAWNGSLEVPTKNAMRDKIEGISASVASNIRRAASSFTSVGTPANTVETDLQSYTLPAATLSSDGQSVRLRASGTLAATSRSRAVRLYFGGTQICNVGPTTNSGLVSWLMDVIVHRTGAATQLATGWTGNNFINATTVTNGVVRATPAETLSGDVLIKVTGQSGGSAIANDVTCDQFLVEVLP